jgi:E3 ubiquitin-protein ligase UBR1
MEIQEDVHHLLGNEAVRRMISKKTNWLMQFLDFFHLFQGMHAQKRESHQHREYESNAWETAHNIIAPITRLMGYLADGYRSATREELKLAFHITMQTTLERCLGLETQKYPYSDPVRPLSWHRVLNTYSVDFRVAKEPVSLYYPLNWMLSLLVSQIVELDRDAPTDWDWWLPWKDGGPERLHSIIPGDPQNLRNMFILACTDYPLRANVFASQIKAKFWARNGLVMTRQVMLYSLMSARCRSFSDFTCLQWGFAVLPAETMLIAMLDRFDLVDHLTDPEAEGKHSLYRDSILIAMVEEFFNLFLELMNERNRALGESPETIVRREIAHRLIFKPLPYSEVLRQVKQFTEVDVDDWFDNNLREMTIFHPPTDAKAGLYELKSKFCSLVDPHHRSYTRNQNIECERVLLELMASRGVPEPNRIVEPQERVLRPIPGPFAGLTKVLGTTLFTRVLFCGIKFAVSRPSELVLDLLLFLCLIAVMDESSQRDFVSNAKSPLDINNISLVHALLAILSRPPFKTLYPKIRRVLSRMKALDPAWFDAVPDVNSALSGVEDAIAAAEAEAKKSLAKKRQMEALNRIRLAQSKFQQTHKELLDEDESDTFSFEEIDRMEVDDESQLSQTFQFPHGVCILCQEETNDDKPYGLPAMIHKHPLQRITPLSEEYFVKEVAMTPTSLDTAYPRPFGQANWSGTRNIVDSENNVKTITEKILGKGFPTQIEDLGHSVTTCGHLLHYRCWQSYFKSVKHRTYNVPRIAPENVDAGEFLCPLCRALSNIVIPIVWSDGVNRHVTSPVYTHLSLNDSSDWLSIFKDQLPQFSEIQIMRRIVPANDFAGVFAGGFFDRSYMREFGGVKGVMYENLLQVFRDHLDMNKPFTRMDEDWDTFPILLAGTISSMELASRGTSDGRGAEMSPPVLGALSSQDVMLLRVLAQSVRTILRYQISTDYSAVWKGFYKKHFHRIIQLCPFNIGGTDPPSLLELDMFERFVVACGVVPLTFGLEVGNLLLIHYVAEITKIALAILVSKPAVDFILADSNMLAAETIPNGPRSLLAFFVSKFDVSPSDKLFNGMYSLMERFVLPFLRKSSIFIHVFENVIFSNSGDNEEVESIRLCRLLGLPSLAEILNMEVSTNNLLFTLIQNWTSRLHKDHPSFDVLKLQHPAIFEVVGLPHRLDCLFEIASKFRCPVCNLVPDEPAMCLLCGKIICTQAVCCEQLGKGEMNLHREELSTSNSFTNSRCSQTIGVFLWLKRNGIIFLRSPSGEFPAVQGEFRDAPYLNIHGESERDFRLLFRRCYVLIGRNGQPQYLSQIRYDKAVRTALLNNAVETGIARRVESIYDYGVQPCQTSR